MEEQGTNTPKNVKVKEELLSPGNIQAENKVSDEPAPQQASGNLSQLLSSMTQVVDKLGEFGQLHPGRVQAFGMVQEAYGDKGIPSIDIMLDRSEKVYQWLTTGKWIPSKEPAAAAPTGKKRGPKPGAKKKAAPKKPILAPMPPRGKPGRKPAVKKAGKRK